jgi:hypothetical protein
MGFALVNKFIANLQVVLQITITLSLFQHFTVHCYTHYCPQSITVSTSRFLATDFNTGTVTVSLNYTLQITHKVFSQLDLQLSTLATNSFLHSLPYRIELCLTLCPTYNISAQTTYKTQLYYCCVHVCCCRNVFTKPLCPSRSRCITTARHTTIYLIRLL